MSSGDVVARSKISGIAVLVAELLFVGSAVASLESCADVKAGSATASVVDQVQLGFGLDLNGRVSPGCAASTFSLRDPIHLSMQVNDAAAGSVLRVAVRDVVSQRIVWSEARPITPGRSSHTFAIGRGLVVGRYRAESSLGGTATNSRNFVVHERLRDVR
jgi:hypothetical protein